MTPNQKRLQTEQAKEEELIQQLVSHYVAPLFPTKGNYKCAFSLALPERQRSMQTLLSGWALKNANRQKIYVDFSFDASEGINKTVSYTTEVFKNNTRFATRREDTLEQHVSRMTPFQPDISGKKLKKFFNQIVEEPKAVATLGEKLKL